MKKTALRLLVLLMSISLSSFSQNILYESFESGIMPPTGWLTVANSPQEVWTAWTTQTTAHSGTYSAYINYAYPYHNSYLITPELLISGHKILSFWYAADYASYAQQYTTLTVEVSTSGYETSQFVAVDTLEFSNNSLEFVNYNLDLSNYVGQNIYIAFHVIDSFGSGVLFDDVTVFEMPNCIPPSDITASDVYTTSATLSWVDNTATSYLVQYIADDEDWSTANSVTVTGNTTTLTGLQTATTYHVRIKSLCDDAGESSWSSTFSFATTCNPIAIANDSFWFEDFESISGNGIVPLPNCWDAAETSIAHGSPFITCGWPPACHSGYNSLELRGNYNEKNIVVLPQFSNQLNSLRLNFYANTTAVAISQAGTLQVGYITDANDPSTFHAVETVNPKTESLDRLSSTLYGPYDFIPAMNEQGRIAIRFVSNNYSTSWNIDDITVSLIPPCAPPSLIQTLNVTSTSADFFWSAQENQLYEILYWVTGTTDTVFVSDVYLDNGPYNIDTLSPSTSYSWTARAVCDDNTYNYSLTVAQFTTPGPSLPLPYSQTFADDAAEITEIEISGSGPSQWAIGDAVGLPDSEDTPTTSRSMYISDNMGTSNHYSGSEWSYSYATMNVQFPNSLMEYHLQFDFKVEGENNWDYFSVYLMDGDEIVPTSGVPSGTALLDNMTDYSGWSHADLVLPNVSGQAKKIVFYWINDNYLFINPPAAVDNITINGNTCARPSLLTALDVQSDEVTLHWQENAIATSWNVYYSPIGAETMTGVIVYDTTIVTLQNLIPNTDYLCFVTANCDEDEESNHSNPLVFRTSCSSNGISTLPYYETFTSTTNLGGSVFDVFVPCWTRLQSDWSHRAYVNTEDFGNNCLDFHYTPNCYTIATMPMFSPDVPVNSLMVNLDIRRQDLSSGPLELGAMVDPNDASTFETIATIPVSNTYVWENHTVYCNGYNGNGQYLAFRVNNGGNNSVVIDNVLVDLLPNCMPVSDITVTDISTNSATLTWDGFSYESFYVYLTGASTEIYAVNGNTLYVTGLQPSSSYSVKIQKICDDEVSIMSEPVGFFTECDPITISEDTPWMENFDNYIGTTEFMPLSNCWDAPLTNQIDFIYFPAVHNTSAAAHSGTNSVELQGTSNMLVFPEFTNDINTLRVSFWANTDATFVDNAGTLMLGYIVDLNTPMSFTPIKTIPVSALGRIGTDSPNADFVGPFDLNTVTPDPGARLAIRFSNTTSYFSWNLDDFVISLIPDCPSPDKNSVTFSNITAEEVTVSWTDSYADHDTWEVHFKPTASDDSEWQTVMVYDTQSTTLTSLLSNTQYDVYVTTYCASSSSAPDATFTHRFTTTLNPVEIPYTTDFTENNDWVFNNGTFGNRWIISTPTPTGTTHALFVTSNGVAPGYDENYYTTITAEKLFTVGNNPEFHISFDIMVGGESSSGYDYDFMKLFLAPSTEQYNPSDYGPAWAEASYSNYACDFSNYLSQTGGSSVPYKFNMTGGNTVHIDAYMTNPNPNPTSTSVAKLAFAWINDNALFSEKPGPVIYNFSIEAVDCVQPYNLSAENIGTTSADIYWGAYDNQTAWIMEYREANSSNWITIPVSTNEYHFDNLNPSSLYYVRIATYCDDDEQSLWSETSFRTNICEVSEQCTYLLVMNDSYGDGWNNATLTITQNDIPVGTYTIGNGYAAQTSVTLCNNMSTSLVWSIGGYDSECSFFLYDPNGVQIYNSPYMSNMSGVLTTFVTNCITVIEDCDVPFGVMVSSITDTSAYADWIISGSEEAWVLEYTTDTLGNWITVDLPYNMHIFEGLTPSTTYYVRVKAICSTNSQSDWSEMVTFTTAGSETPVEEPVVITNIAMDITATSATLNGALLSLGDQPILARGFEWKVSNDGTYQIVYFDGIDPIFDYHLENLTPSTNYTFRAFATTAINTYYGNERNFNTLEQPAICEMPTNLAATDTANESITISWTDNAGATSWTVRHRKSGEDWISTTVTNNPYTLENLTGHTQYEIQVRALCDDGLISEWTPSIFVTTTNVGIPEYLFKSIVLYPNPTNDFINVECRMNNEEYSISDIQLIDVYGKVVRTVETRCSTSLPTRINVSDLAAGMYFVRVTTDQGAVTKSFVKK